MKYEYEKQAAVVEALFWALSLHMPEKRLVQETIS